MLVYDITERESFDNIRNWITEIKTYGDSKVNILLVGNKCDNEDERRVSYKEGSDLAAEIGVHFWEVSAKNDVNVRESYEDIALSTKRK
jgi:GTPase SAR1 family protein